MQSVTMRKQHYLLVTLVIAICTFTGVQSCSPGCPADHFCNGNDTCLKLPRLLNPPSVTGVACTSASLMWQSWTKGYDVGDIPAKKYNLYQQEEFIGSPWIHYATYMHFDSDVLYKETLQNLNPATRHRFRVDAIGMYEGSYLTQFVTGSETPYYILDCQDDETTESTSVKTTIETTTETSAETRMTNGQLSSALKTTKRSTFITSSTTTSSTISSTSSTPSSSLSTATTALQVSSSNTSTSTVGQTDTFSDLKAEIVDGSIMMVTWSVNTLAVSTVVRSFLDFGLAAIGNCEVVSVVRWLRQQVTITQTSVNITDWEFWSSYQIRLSVTHKNDHTDTQSISITTPNRRPDQPVANLQVVSSTTVSATIDWVTPPCEAWGSEVIKYGFQITELISQIIITSGITQQTTLQLAGLQAYTRYSISITIQNEVGAGPISIILLETKEDVPGKPSIKELIPGHDSVNISISESYPSTGAVLEYRIEYSQSRDFDTGVTWEMVTGASTVILSSMTPFTTYYIRVKARNNAGWGTFGDVWSITTLQDYPQAPSALNLTSQNETTIGIEWKAPAVINGVLLGYKVNFTKEEALSGQSILVNNSTTYLLLTGLHSASYYYIEISAQTMPGYGSPVNGILHTMLAPPAKPAPPVVSSKTSSTVTVAINTSVVTTAHLVSIRIYAHDITVDAKLSQDPLNNGTPPGNLQLLIYPNILNKSTVFTVGDDKVYNGVHNAPLTKGHTYYIYMSIMTSFEGTALSSFSKVIDSVTLTESKVIYTTQPPAASRNIGLMMLAIITGVLFVPGIILTIVIINKHRKHEKCCWGSKQESKNSNSSRTDTRDVMNRDSMSTTKLMSSNIFLALDQIQEHCKSETLQPDLSILSNGNLNAKEVQNTNSVERKAPIPMNTVTGNRRTMSDAGLYTSVFQNMSFLDQYQQEDRIAKSLQESNTVKPGATSNTSVNNGQDTTGKRRSKSFQEKSDRVQNQIKPARPPPPLTMESTFLELRRKACSPIMEEENGSYGGTPRHPREEKEDGHIMARAVGQSQNKPRKERPTMSDDGAENGNCKDLGNSTTLEEKDKRSRVVQKRKRRQIIASRRMAINKQNQSSSDTDDDIQQNESQRTRTKRSYSFQENSSPATEVSQSPQKGKLNPSHKIKSALEDHSLQKRLNGHTDNSGGRSTKRSQSFQIRSKEFYEVDHKTVSDTDDPQDELFIKDEVKNISDDTKLSRKTSSEDAERPERKRRHTLQTIPVNTSMKNSHDTDDYKATQVSTKVISLDEKSSINDIQVQNDSVKPKKQRSVSMLRSSSPTKYLSSHRGQDVLQYWSKTFSFLDHRKILSQDEVEEENRKLCYSIDPPDRPQTVSLELEFRSLPTEALGSCHVAYSRSKNPQKNFFDETYDHSRVKIQPEGDDDFISASYIHDKDFGGRKAYIAAKSPDDFKSSQKFWRMILQENVSVIVKLSQTLDVYPEKISYWTGSKEEHYSLIHSRDIYRSTYIIHRMKVIHELTRACRRMRILHLNTWPDKDRYFVPYDTENFLEMRNLVRKYQAGSLAPIVVHASCSDGRIGVFISIDALLQEFHQTQQINVFTFVRSMLKDRYGMLKTIWQYRFIYEAIFEYSAHGS